MNGAVHLICDLILDSPQSWEHVNVFIGCEAVCRSQRGRLNIKMSWLTAIQVAPFEAKTESMYLNNYIVIGMWHYAVKVKKFLVETTAARVTIHCIPWSLIILFFCSFQIDGSEERIKKTRAFACHLRQQENYSCSKRCPWNRIQLQTLLQTDNSPKWKVWCDVLKIFALHWDFPS